MTPSGSEGFRGEAVRARLGCTVSCNALRPTDKPKGWAQFDDLMQKLVTVPKEQVDQKIADDKAKRKARRKKK
jgi:hypothetical protein